MIFYEGYVCCNKELNDLMVETYTEMEARPKFHTCNVQALATNLQSYAQQRFNTTFETIVGLEDFAQKVHFGGDLVCKVELGGRPFSLVVIYLLVIFSYMLAYATVRDVEEYRLPSIGDKSQYGPVNYIPSHHISKRNTIRI
uniref:Ground-like domain-containing protein n=1 Tax=Heterorhabditis bacteriophora TaxID=37862 RepID=A0A1I7X3W4_HETBA